METYIFIVQISVINENVSKVHATGSNDCSRRRSGNKQKVNDKSHARKDDLASAHGHDINSDD